jgi:MFS transporter, DHA2 family, multidrug resistance protein
MKVLIPPGNRNPISPWLLGAAVILPALIGAVGTTFVGVARPYIAGGLSAPATDDEWVMISYLAAIAFILPVTGCAWNDDFLLEVLTGTTT